jgi:DnaJ-domain-containing protein 1
MHFLAIRAYFDALRQWPVTTISLTLGLHLFGQYFSQFESTGEPTGEVWRAAVVFLVCGAIAVMFAAVAPPIISRVTRKLLGLSDEDFDGVLAETSHMSFRWMYENSAKGKRDSRRRQAGENSFDGTPPVDAYSDDKALEANLAVLELKVPATFSEIKERYRQLVLKNHPDVLTQSDDPEADGRMAEINRAFDWLEDRYAVKS